MLTSEKSKFNFSERTGTSTEGATTEDVVVLCLADSERIEYQKAAERCGLSLATWIRDRLKTCAKRESKDA